MSEPTKPKSYFGRVLLLNLSLVVLLHGRRELLYAGSGIYEALYILAFINLVMALVFFATGRGGNGRACLLSALLIGIAGFSDCVTHLRIDTH